MTSNLKNKTDVVVVGAGPAGSSAARIAAKSGLDVIILEKQAEVGKHVQCGEGVTCNINRIDPEIRLKKEHIASKIGTLKIILPNGTTLVLGRRNPHTDGYIINRDLYDHYLAEKAEKYGAEIRTESPALEPIIKKKRVRGVVVHNKHNHEKYELYGKVVVAADGISSLIGKEAGLPVQLEESEVCPCAESRFSNIEVDPHIIEVWFLPEGSMQGYAWVFPKSNNVANVGIGVMSHVLHQKGLNVQDILDNFIKKRFYNQNPKPILKMNGVVPLGICRQLVAPGICLCGDSGRMVSPISGAGIENSIKAGIILGGTIADGGFSTNNLKRYEAEYMKRIGRKMQAFLYFRKGLEVAYDLSPNAIWWAGDLVKMMFDFQHTFIDLTGGREKEPMISTGIGGKIVKMARKVS
jgi:digeranylgeranylglycerophospholipid reductase